MNIQALIGFGLNLEISWSNFSLPHNKRYSAKDDVHLSGTSLDIAIALQRCGVSVKLLGAVGRQDQLDLFSLIKRDLVKRSLSHSLLRLRERTAIASIETPSGRHLSSKLEMRETHNVPIERIVKRVHPKIRIVSGLMPDKEEVEFAIRFFQPNHGFRVLNFRRAFATKSWQLLKLIAKKIDLLYLNRHEAATFVGCRVDEIDFQSAFKLLDLGPQMVIITKDSDGAILVNQKGEKISVPAYNAGEIIDPSGAGDCFLAFFLANWLKSNNMNQALYQAAVAAGIKVTRLGAHNMPCLKEVDDIIAKK